MENLKAKKINPKVNVIAAKVITESNKSINHKTPIIENSAYNRMQELAFGTKK